jgi:hypothetical protein
MMACSNAQPSISQRFILRPTDDTLRLPDPQLGISMTTTDTIETFWLNGWKRDTSATGLQSFKILKRGATLRGHAKDELIQIVKNPSMYVQDSIFKRCEFAPNLGFRWKAGNHWQILLVSLDCDVWQWHRTGVKPLVLEMDPAHPFIRQFANKLFTPAEINALNSQANHERGGQTPSVKTTFKSKKSK